MDGHQLPSCSNRRVRALVIGLASATRSSNRWLAILAISISAAARSWAGEFSIRCQPGRRMASPRPDVAHGHDQREAELLAVGRGRARRTVAWSSSFSRVRPGADWSRTESCRPRRRRPVRAEVGVGLRSARAAVCRASENRASWNARRSVVGVRERPPVVGPLGHPAGPLEQPAEGARRTPRGSSSLTWSSRTCVAPAGRPPRGRSPCRRGGTRGSARSR